MPSVSIPSGGSETISIGQRKNVDGDPIELTVDVYDALGNLVDVYEPAVADAVNGGTMTRPHTHHDYDASGNETSMTDADGNTTQFSYDAIGNQIGQTLPMNQTSSNIYNICGELDHSFDFKGNETKYAYDSQGRVQTISYYPATNLSTADDVLTYTYTPLGQVYTINDSGTGRTDTYSYDPSGNMIEDQSVQGGLTQTVYHTYDPATGLLMRTWTADGASDESFSYDTQGRLSVVTSGSQVTTYTYDANGNLHSTTTVNGSTTTVATNTYDDLNRLTDLTNTVNGMVVSEYTYTLDSEGNRIQAVETLNGSTQTINYQYDANDRLTEEKYTVAGNVTLKIDYTYDLDGNRITETQSGSAATATGTTISSYNANNELVTVEAPDGSYTFSYYDANGSLISTATASSLTGTQTTTATYTFNDRNQLVADTVNGNTDSYSYDSSGDRISKTTNGTVTNYEFDTASPTGYDQVLAETSSTGSVQLKYVWGLQIVGETIGSTTSLYELDGHGSVRQLVNVGSHAVSDTYYYDAFGNLLSSSGSTSNVYRFAGMRLDGWSGAYDDAARYYTPQTGEFISRDGDYGSKNDPISLNKYLYANADPVNVWDPSGHDGLADLLVSMSISSGLDAIVMPAIHSVVGRAISSIAIPQSLQNALNSAETPDAVVFELPASGSVTAKVWGPFSGTGGVGLEAAVSPRTGNSALYGYWYLGVSTGAQKGLSGSLFDSGIGLFWGAANSHDYTGAAALLHFPANLLSPKLTNKLATAIVTGASALGTGAINGLSGYVGGPTNASSLVSDVPAAVNFVKANIDKFYVDVFVWAGSIGVTLNYAPVNFGESEDNFSLSYSDTYQLNPKNSVAF